MKKTAVAPSNIAFIKYWGKRVPEINLPMNNSISMNLKNCLTVATVEFNPTWEKDLITLNGKALDEKKTRRVTEHLDRIRKMAGKNFFAKVDAKNNFPLGVGIASSASGFAALSLAATEALGLNLSQKELSVLSRLGSGSACRSIPDGFVEWHKGESSETSFAESIAPPSHWELLDIVVIFSEEEKEVSSRDGHTLAKTSPYYKTRLAELPKRTKELRSAILGKDLEKLGTLIEEEAISLHIVAMSSRPPIFYWQPKTLLLIQEILGWRKEGLPAYFTIDAGPNLHIVTEETYEDRVLRKLKGFNFIKKVISNTPAAGAALRK